MKIFIINYYYTVTQDFKMGREEYLHLCKQLITVMYP